MRGTKHLAELVNVNSFYIDSLNVIEAPTGCGKTYFALDYFPSLEKDSEHKILYLIDTRNGLEQLIAYYDNAQREYSHWIDEVNGNVAIENWDVDNRDVVVLTYARFGIICGLIPNFQDNFEYIICDELPSLIKYQSFSPKPNCHSIAKTHIESAVLNDHTVVIALTATPKVLDRGFYVDKHSIYVNKDELITYTTPQPILYAKIDDVIKKLDPNKVGLCYVSRVHTMLEIQKIAEASGLKPICVWSINYEKIKMTEEQLHVREEIIKNFRIPSDYNFLIINASSETSIKIKDPIVDYVIVHSTNEDTQIQVRGRISNDISSFYLPSAKYENADLIYIDIPDEYLGRKLFNDDKEKLCSLFNIRNPYNNRLLRWTSLKNILSCTNYAIAEGRERNLRYNIITRLE